MSGKTKAEECAQAGRLREQENADRLKRIEWKVDENHRLLRQLLQEREQEQEPREG